MSDFIPIYNIDAMTESQRQDYVRAVCRHLGIPDNLNLVNIGFIDDVDGPRRMVTFVKRGAYEGVRSNHGISTEITKTENIGGSFVVTAVGTNGKGRKETALGAKYISGLTGKDLDDAIMTAQTRAMNRSTLQFIGAGILDESEVQQRDTKAVINTTPVVIPPTPTVQVNSQVGNDVTPSTTAAATATSAVEATQTGLPLPPWMDSSLTKEQQQAVFVAEQEKMREQAIASLNKQNTPEVLTEGTPKVKKTRSPRKSKVDLGPSEPVPAASNAAVTPPTPTPVPVAPVAVPESAPVPSPAPVAAPAPTKNRLAPEVLKPFRTRQFQFVTELEQNGFAPKEGVGNLDKMRQFVGMLFPEVNNFNDLTVEQWEKYLTIVEAKLKANGAKETIKYIEEAIGV